MKRYPAAIVLLLSALSSMSFHNGLLAEEKKPTWKPLMDGETLAGWHKIGEGQWTVEDGAFVGRADKTKLYGLLVSDDVLEDFTVRMKFKCRSGDSGFYIRTVFKDPDQAHGLQVQVGLGEVEYNRVINQLRREDYNLALSVELFPEMMRDTDRALEMRKMRMLLDSLL